MSDDSDNEKTHDPTQKRLDDAHQKGDVAKSQEVNTWFLIAGATLVMSSFGSSIGSGLQVPMRNLIANSWMIRVDGPGLIALAKTLGSAVFSAMAMPMLFLVIAAVGGNLI